MPPTARPARRRRAVLCLLTAAFALRGVFLILVLPWGDPLDEPFHLAYAQFVAAHGRPPGERESSMPLESRRLTVTLPRSTSFGGPHLWWSAYRAMPPESRWELRREAFEHRPGERFTYLGPNYETQQPPLFYLLAAVPLRALAGAPTNRALLAGRLLALALAICAVPLAYRFFRRLFAQPTALAATLAFATFPGLGTFTGRMTNDDLALPLVLALLGLFADAARGRLARRGSAALALCLAAACWTKLYALLFLPVAPAAALLAPRSRRDRSTPRQRRDQNIPPMRRDQKVPRRRRDPNTPRPRRWTAVRQALAGSALAVLAVLPWAAHQHAATGDWFGLTFTKDATRAGAGLARHLAAIPHLFRPEMFAYGWRSWIYPGTWSSIGAPAPTLWLASLALLALWIVPQLAPGRRSARRRAAWLGGALAVAAFAVGQIAYAASVAAVSPRPTLVGGEGWYFLVVLPVVLAAGAALGKPVPPRLFVAAAALFAAADWIATLGVLPATYGGWIEKAGALAPLAAYRFLLSSPGKALDVLASVALVDVPAAVLALLALAWLAALAAAAALLFRPRRGLHAAAPLAPIGRSRS